MEKFQFGRTISRTFELIRGAIVPVGIFVLIIQLVSLVINWTMMGQVLVGTQDPSHAAAIMLSPAYWLMILFSFVFGGLLWPGMISGYLRISRGERVTVGECFSAGLAMLLPVMVITILWILGMMLGWMLLLVPGIMLMVMWSVVLPAYVAERPGIFGSFGRSRALTKGSRWTIFGVLFVALLIMYVPIVVLGGVLSGGFAAMAGTPGAGLGMGFYVFMLPYGWAIGMFLGALLTSIYIETRLVRGDLEGSTISEVFG